MFRVAAVRGCGPPNNDKCLCVMKLFIQQDLNLTSQKVKVNISVSLLLY